MKAKPLRVVDGIYQVCEAADATHIRLRLPGPIPDRVLPVIQKGTRKGTPNWTWNGSVDKPTLRPSILSNRPPHRCHSWIADGQAQFLGDCSHELAGQTLDLLDIDPD